MGEGSDRMLDREARGGDALNSSAHAGRDRQRIPVSLSLSLSLMLPPARALSLPIALARVLVQVFSDHSLPLICKHTQGSTEGMATPGGQRSAVGTGGTDSVLSSLRKNTGNGYQGLPSPPPSPLPK